MLLGPSVGAPDFPLLDPELELQEPAAMADVLGMSAAPRRSERAAERVPDLPDLPDCIVGAEGLLRGFEVGALLGFAEGFDEGLLLGIAEGEGEGMLLGPSVGAPDFPLLDPDSQDQEPAAMAELLDMSAASRRLERAAERRFALPFLPVGLKLDVIEEGVPFD